MSRYFALFLLFFVSCKKESAPPPIDKELIYGWWYQDQQRSEFQEYRGRSFNTDGTMTVDRTNLGLGMGSPGGGGNWHWSGDTIVLSGFGSVKFHVTKLDKDSMYCDLYDGRPTGALKMYYSR